MSWRTKKRKERPLPTTEKLARALEAEKDPRLEQMIERARAGYYDDYKSELTFPIRTLVEDLGDLGKWDLVRRAMAGEFDATREESDEWARSPEGQETFRALLERTRAFIEREDEGE